MLPGDPQTNPDESLPDDCGSDAKTELIVDLVAEVIAAKDPSEGLSRIRRDHPDAIARVERAYARLVREDMVDSSGSMPGLNIQLEGYRWIRRLGRGGMGVVHLAEQEAPRRLVAIKLLRPELLHVESSRIRFRHEIMAVARLQHPGIVQVFEAREDSETPCFVMEFVDGPSMREIVHGLRGQDPSRLHAGDLLAMVEDRDSTSSTGHIHADMPWQDLGIRFGRELCDALQHAHERGVLHRDVKPSNILLTRDARVRLVDFGLARLEGETRLTRSEAELGSLPFIPPENLRGTVLPSERRDVYGLGVTLYEFLTLHNPFLADDIGETRRRILRAQVPTLRQWNASVSWELDTVIQKAMAPEPEQRYASARAFGEDLARVARREPILARRPGAALRTRRWLQRHPSMAGMMAVAIVLLFVGAVAIALRESRARQESERLTRISQESGYVAKIQSAALLLDHGDSLDEIRALLADCPTALRGFEWRHLAERLDSALSRVPAPEGRIMNIEWAADARHFAVLMRTGEIVIYDHPGDTLVTRWKIADLATEGFAWRPGTDEIVYSLTDGTILIRSTREAVHPHAICASASERGAAVAMAFSRDGSVMFTGHEHGQILRWDVEQRKITKVLRGSGQGIFSLSLSDGMRTLVAGTFAGNGRVPAATLAYRLGTDHYDEFAQPGSLVVSACTDRKGRFIFAASNAGLELLDLERGKRRFLFRGSCLFPSLSRDQTRLAFMVGKRRLRVLELGPAVHDKASDLHARPMAQLLGHQQQIFDVAAEPGTHRFWTGGDDPVLRSWDADRSAPTFRLPGSPHRVTAMVQIPDGAILTGDSKGAIRSHGEGGSRLLAQASGSEVLDLGRDGRGQLIVVQSGGTVSLLDEVSGKIRGQQTLQGVTCCATWGPDYLLGTVTGRLVRMDDGMSTADVLTTPLGSPIAALDTHDASLVVSTKDGVLRCFDADTLRPRWRHQAHEGWIADARIDPRGRVVVSIGQDRTAAIWDLVSGRVLHRLGGMDRAPLALAFSPMGDRLATSSGYGRDLRIWETQRGALLTRLAIPCVPFALVFTDRLLVAAGMADAAFGGGAQMGEIYYWRAATRSLPPHHHTPVTQDRLTPPPTRIR